MAARPTWKGFLKISLVNIPIRVFPGDRLGGDHQLQPAACGVSDAHPAEALVPALRARSADVRDRQGLRVREGPLRRGQRGRHGQGPAGVDPGHRPRAVHRRGVDRSDLRRASVLPRPRRADGEGGVRGHARGHEGEGRHRQARALRPRVPGRRAGAREGAGDVHDAPRRRSAQHGQHRGARRRPDQDQAGRDQAREAGDRQLRRRRSI